tara:strand:- start:64 stop:507 length:444 start_codon:yes stop_codon:yes gene_type:complete
MSSFNKLLKKDQHYLVLMVLLAVFIVLDIQVPAAVAELVDTIVGKIIIVVIALSMCTSKQPILCALSLLAAYELIRRSSNSNIGPAVMKFIPTEAKKSGHLSAMNQFPVTVEEQVIAEMIPQEAAPILTAPSFKPTQSKLHDAAKLN